jgi:FAD binding domain/Berberine and berberine like
VTTERYDRQELLARSAAALIAGAAAGSALGARAPSAGALRRLARELHGPLVTPSSRAYASSRLLYNPRFDGVRPRAIAYCTSVEDVQRTIRWAQKHGVRLTPRCGGHSYGGYSTSNGIVLDVTRLNRVRTAAGRATIGAGALLIDVYARLAARGVTIPAGTCPSVGIAGLALGGGHGYSLRKLGLTCDALESVTIVTAEGRVLTCDERHHADLFWACRGGGGGSFGVVTQFRFRTSPVDTVAYYSIQWPWSDAAAAFEAWQSFAPHAPDELSSTLFLAATAVKREGATPAITSSGQFYGSASALQSPIAPLVNAGTPTRVQVGTLSYLDAVKRWAGCSAVSVAECHRSDKSPAGRLPRLTFKGKSQYALAPLASGGIAEILHRLEARQADPNLGRGEVILDAYGGAVARVPKAATAFVHRDALASIQYVAIWNQTDPASVAQANLRWIDGLAAGVRPYVSGSAYQNYIDPSLVTWKQAYYGSNLRRLVSVKRKYDRRNFFHFPQSIPTRL